MDSQDAKTSKKHCEGFWFWNRRSRNRRSSQLDAVHFKEWGTPERGWLALEVEGQGVNTGIQADGTLQASGEWQMKGRVHAE